MKRKSCGHGLLTTFFLCALGVYAQARVTEIRIDAIEPFATVRSSERPAL